MMTHYGWKPKLDQITLKTTLGTLIETRYCAGRVSHYIWSLKEDAYFVHFKVKL